MANRTETDLMQELLFKFLLEHAGGTLSVTMAQLIPLRERIVELKVTDGVMTFTLHREQ